RTRRRARHEGALRARADRSGSSESRSSSSTARDRREEQHLVAVRELGLPVAELVVDRDLAADPRVRETVALGELAEELGRRAGRSRDPLGLGTDLLAKGRE